MHMKGKMVTIVKQKFYLATIRQSILSDNFNNFHPIIFNMIPSFTLVTFSSNFSP